MKHLFVLNAPPRAGKDTVASYLAGRNLSRMHVEFKNTLIDMALTMSGIDADEWDDRYTSMNSQGTAWLKDMPWLAMGGLSQREYLIMVSEEFVKPVFGDQHFGNLLKADLDESGGYIFISSDGGFTEELVPFLRDPDWSVSVIELKREGCTFEGDSRNFIHIKGVPRIVIDNNGSIIKTVAEANEFIKSTIIKAEKEKK